MPTGHHDDHTPPPTPLPETDESEPITTAPDKVHEFSGGPVANVIINPRIKNN